MIAAIGRFTLARAGATLDLVELFFRTGLGFVRGLLKLRIRGPETLDQMVALGVQSLPVVAFSIAFIAFILITEFSFHMKLVLRQDSLVPSFSTVLLIRELGPVVTSLLLCSRIGAGIGAEIGLMKNTDQLDALRLLGVDLVEYLVIPRWVASVFAAVSLTVVSLAVACVAAACLGAAVVHTTVEQYFNTMFVFTHFSDLVNCLIKAAVFGTIIPIVAAHQGFRCEAGSRGVGEAATNAVVQASLYIIASDFVLTYLLFAL